VPVVVVALLLAIAAIDQEVVVAGIMQLAAPVWELMGLGFFPPPTPKFEAVQGCVQAGRFLSACLPVCVILGPPSAPHTTVAAVGGVMQQGVFPRHLRDHLVQLPEAPVSRGQA